VSNRGFHEAELENKREKNKKNRRGKGGASMISVNSSLSIKR